MLLPTINVMSHIITIIIIIIILVFAFMQGIYNYIPETNHVSMVYSVASVLYLQFGLHVMLFRPWNMFCTFTLALSVACLQRPIRLFSLISCFPGYVTQVLYEWLWNGSSRPYYYWYHFYLYNAHSLSFYYYYYHYYYNPTDTTKDLGAQLDSKAPLPSKRRLYFLPIRKDFGFNMHYNLFLLYPWELINIVLKLQPDPNSSMPHLYGNLYRLLTPKSWNAFSGSL